MGCPELVLLHALGLPELGKLSLHMRVLLDHLLTTIHLQDLFTHRRRVPTPPRLCRPRRSGRVAAAHLQEGKGVECDVLVCGNKKAARDEVIKLVEAAGMRGFHAGMINNAAAAEALTSVLIVINKQYDCHAGIKISGLHDAG